MKIRKIIGSFHIYAIFGICLHAVVRAVGVVVYQGGFKFDPTIFQRPCQLPFPFNTEIAVYVSIELCFVVGVLTVVGHPAADTIWAMIWHRHIPERTVTGVEATHVHLVHIGEGIAVDSASIAMGCDVEDGFEGYQCQGFMGGGSNPGAESHKADRK